MMYYMGFASALYVDLKESEMSAGWQWAYRALKDGRMDVETMKTVLYEIFPGDTQFHRDATRGLADYLEELADEEAIAREEQDGQS